MWQLEQASRRTFSTVYKANMSKSNIISFTFPFILLFSGHCDFTMFYRYYQLKMICYDIEYIIWDITKLFTFIFQTEKNFRLLKILPIIFSKNIVAIFVQNITTFRVHHCTYIGCQIRTRCARVKENRSLLKDWKFSTTVVVNKCFKQNKFTNILQIIAPFTELASMIYHKVKSLKSA